MQAKSNSSNDQGGIFAVLDIGTTKICCMIGRYVPYLEADDFENRLPDLSVIGIGVQASNGIKSGVVIDMDDAEHAIRAAVSDAERMAGLTIESVILPVSCGRLKSENIAATDNIHGRAVEKQDIARLMEAGHDHATQDDRVVLHMMPVGFSLDENTGIRDPQGMVGDELAADIHAVTAERSPLHNMQLLVERCDLTVSGIIAAPYVSALSAIVTDEARLGVTCIDIGGGTTKLSVFAEGHFIYSDSIALGGQHVTLDIARALNTSVEEAERIKTRYGNVVTAMSDDQEMIMVSRVGDPAARQNQLSTANLGMLIRPRIEEILAVMSERLNASGLAQFAGQHVVLTGGTANLAGIDQYAAHLLGKSVRIGPPRPVSGLPDDALRPEYASAIGTLLFPLYPQPLYGHGFYEEENHTGTGYLSRVGQWFMESF